MPFALDRTARLPGTWALAALLVLVHGATALAAPHPWRALLFTRSAGLRVGVGGQVRTLVAEGQLWRLVTSVFLHGDLLHLAVNVVALFALGRLLEPWLGVRRLWAWFLLGGVGGSITSQVVGVPRSDGASGGLFALLGVALVLGWRLRDELDAEDRRLLGPVLQVLVVANVVLSFVLPFVDAAGHLGGLAVGVTVAAALRRTNLRGGKVAVGLEWAWLAACAIVALGGWFG